MPIWRHISAGLAASLIGIGLARFAYTPLIPSLIRLHWFPANDVVFLGAANLAGYLLGAVCGRPIGERIGNVTTIRLMEMLVTLSFAACAYPISVAWFFLWRLASGMAGGVMMVLLGATLFPHLPPRQRGIGSGAVFLGLGLGIEASGTVVPFLLNYGLRPAWLGLAVISAAMTALTWHNWPMGAPPPQPAPVKSTIPCAWLDQVKYLIFTEYALMAVGLVPPMVFLVDFVARGLGGGERLGAWFWILYGLGAIAGPPLYGLLADRMRPRRALRLLLLAQIAALAPFAWSDSHILLAAAALVIGSFPPGIVPLVLACVRTTFPDDSHKQNLVWGQATIVFAAAQALAGYGYSALFAASDGNHRLLFAISIAAIVTVLIIDQGAPLFRRSESASGISP